MEPALSYLSSIVPFVDPTLFLVELVTIVTYQGIGEPPTSKQLDRLFVINYYSYLCAV